MARAIADLYTIRSSVALDSLHSIVSTRDSIRMEGVTTADLGSESAKQADQFSFKWMIEHTIFPAARSFVPSQSLASQRVVCEVACLENLYKIFERC